MNTPDPSGAASTRKPPDRGRRWGRLMAVILLWLVLFEGAGWLADARWGHRAKLLEALALSEPSQIPVPPWEKLPWPDGSLMTRRADSAAATPPRPYVIGGRLIPNAFIRPLQEGLWPDHFSTETRKQVFIVGGSAAFGYTVRSEDSFGGLLGAALKNTHAVYNSAQVGWASGQVASVVDAVLTKAKPKVLIVMSGNNEWARWQELAHPWMDPTRIAMYRLLARSRIVAEVLYFSANRAIDAAHVGVESTRGEYRIHQEIGGFSYALRHPSDPEVPFNSAHWLREKTKFLDAFEQHLRRIVSRAKAKGVRVILATVPFNYRLSVAWKTRQPEAFRADTRTRVRAWLHEAAALIAGGDPAAALRLIDKAIALDPLPPILQHLRGHCLEQLDRDDEAEQAYAMARENMVGDLGSRVSINERIMKVASESGTELVDVKAIFDKFERGIGGHFNEHLIVDDCHPNLMGHRMIAKALHDLLHKRK